MPPRQAFNDRQGLLAKIEEIEEESGTLRWRTDPSSQRGSVHSNLCDECNQRLGNSYNRAYVDFAHQVASSRGLEAGNLIDVLSVKYPLRVLKTAIHCFASSLGAEFVSSNEWCKPFLLNREDQQLPDLVHVYLYAMATEGAGRSTGPMGMTKISNAGFTRPKIVAEFAFWPVGILLSYVDLDALALTPIRHFKTYPWGDAGPLDLTLPVHETATPFPLDFRSMEEVIAEAGGQVPPWHRPQSTKRWRGTITDRS